MIDDSGREQQHDGIRVQQFQYPAVHPLDGRQTINLTDVDERLRPGDTRLSRQWIAPEHGGCVPLWDVFLRYRAFTPQTWLGRA